MNKPVLLVLLINHAVCQSGVNTNPGIGILGPYKGHLRQSRTSSRNSFSAQAPDPNCSPSANDRRRENDQGNQRVWLKMKEEGLRSFLAHGSTYQGSILGTGFSSHSQMATKSVGGLDHPKGILDQRNALPSVWNLTLGTRSL